MAIIIKIPVVVGKRETLIKSRPTQFELLLDTIVISAKYIISVPKDINDDYSALEELLSEWCMCIKKSEISYVWWIWDSKKEHYSMELVLKSDQALCFAMESKLKAVELYNTLNNWWLN